MSPFSLRIVALLFMGSLALSAAPGKWEKDIVKFEAAAKANPHPEGALLFVGSSSIRMWDLKSSFPKQATINHGFGGSELEDSLHFADRIIIPHAPAMVLLYAGDNDINNGKNAERVVEDYKKFVARIQGVCFARA